MYDLDGARWNVRRVRECWLGVDRYMTKSSMRDDTTYATYSMLTVARLQQPTSHSARPPPMTQTQTDEQLAPRNGAIPRLENKDLYVLPPSQSLNDLFNCC